MNKLQTNAVLPLVNSTNKTLYIFQDIILSNLARTNLKAVAVSPENYEKIKDLGRAGDSMNSVITRLIDSYIARGS